MANCGYCYQSIDLSSGYNITNTNYTYPILAQGSSSNAIPAVNQFQGFPNVQLVSSTTPPAINGAQLGGGSIGYQIGGTDLFNNASNCCAAYSIICNSSQTLQIPSWAGNIGFLLSGGGGGGGSGGTTFGDQQYACGGSGGGSGAIFGGLVPVSWTGPNGAAVTVQNSFNVVVGTGGSGGTAPQGGILQGNPGNSGNRSYISFIDNASPYPSYSMVANGGGGGGGGMQGTGSTAPVSSPGNGGTCSNTFGPNLQWYIGGNASNANGGGKNPQGTNGADSPLNAINSNFPNINATNYTFPVPLPSYGGGGVRTESAAGGGGNGYGSGGGGGAGTNGKANGGNGGAGAPGYAQIWFYI